MMIGLLTSGLNIALLATTNHQTQDPNVDHLISISIDHRPSTTQQTRQYKTQWQIHPLNPSAAHRSLLAPRQSPRFWRPTIFYLAARHCFILSRFVNFHLRLYPKFHFQRGCSNSSSCSFIFPIRRT